MAPPRTAEHERCAGHPGTVSGDTAVERVTAIEPAWPAWKAGSSDGVFAGQRLARASDSVPVTHP